MNFSFQTRLIQTGIFQTLYFKAVEQNIKLHLHSFGSACYMGIAVLASKSYNGELQLLLDNIASKET